MRVNNSNRIMGRMEQSEMIEGLCALNRRDSDSWTEGAHALVYDTAVARVRTEQARRMSKLPPRKFKLPSDVFFSVPLGYFDLFKDVDLKESKAYFELNRVVAFRVHWEEVYTREKETYAVLKKNFARTLRRRWRVTDG